MRAAELYVIDIEGQAFDTGYDGLLEMVSKTEGEKALTYKLKGDQLRSLFASVLVRFVGSIKLNIPMEACVIAKTPLGKPYIETSHNQFFNLSHSEKWVVCAWSHQEIGVDIECRKAYQPESFHPFLHPRELEIYHTLEGREQMAFFFDLWTLKESYLKYKGCGLVKALCSIGFRLDKVTPELMTGDERGLKFYNPYVDVDYSVSVCTQASLLHPVHKIELSRIRQQFHKVFR